jgi:LexA-binding, inner membrane-associated putative hydrolase
MTATSHRIFNLGAALALSFHWWVWLLFFLAASLPDQLEPAVRNRSRFRSHRGLFHTYSVWILLGLTIFWLPTAPVTFSGIPLFNTGVKVLVWIFLAGVLCHLLADTGSRQGCSILLPCDCGRLGYCRCHWYTRRLSLKCYRTGEFSEAVCLFLFCGFCATIAAWRWKNHLDLLS